MEDRVLDVPHVETALPVKKKPCADCPMRRAHPAGWLGGSSVDDYVSALHGEHNIPCHSTPGFEAKDWNPQRQRPCAGVAIYRRNVCKTPRNEQAAAAARAVEADRETVFASPVQFREHHDRSLIKAGGD